MTMSDAELDRLQERLHFGDRTILHDRAADAIASLRAERDALAAAMSTEQADVSLAYAAMKTRAERAEADAARLRPALGNAIRMLEEEYGAVDPDHLYWATEQIKEMKDVYAAIAAEKESHS